MTAPAASTGRSRSRVAVMLGAVGGSAVVAAVAFSALDHRYGAAFSVLPIAVAVVLGCLIVVRSTNPVGGVLAVYGVSAGLESAGVAYARWAMRSDAAWRAGWRVAVVGPAFLPLAVTGLAAAVLPQLFPTGRPVSARWRTGVVAGAGFIVLGVIGNGFADQEIEGLDGLANPFAIRSMPTVWPVVQAAAGICFVVAMVFGLAALVTRWRQGVGDERQQLKWLCAGLVPYLIVIVVHDAVSVRMSDVIAPIGFSALPIAVAVAVLRYRLYDLDLLVNRALVVASASATVALVYLLSVALVQGLVARHASLGTQVAAAVVAAACFAPARARGQRLVDRAFYGERARPFDVLVRFGSGFENLTAPEDVLDRTVGMIVSQLRVPGAAIDLRRDDEWSRTSIAGAVEDASCDELAMTYQGRVIGRLLVHRRGREEPFDAAEQRLLGELARHASVAAHAAGATIELRRSRAEIVGAREEERRRIRRDLHDGVGPTLAGISLGLHAARAALHRDVVRAEFLLDDACAHVAETVVDIRRLVHDLRPPVLDSVGLVEAIRRHLASIAADAPFTLTVTGPSLEPAALPAAVEVAAFRIASEAVTNVARHAAATCCTVVVEVGEALVVGIEDDGQGIPADAQPGVGMAAMRERAAELGGACSIASSASGTVVRATIPMRLP